MSKVKKTDNRPLKRKNKKTKKRKTKKSIDGYYIADGKVHVLKKDWVFGI
tara:strand:+ start:321 stop:470 length:150 start_codon:yes stop_codon:yes gene_type:complete